MRKLSTILAADIVAFSRLIGADEEGTLNSLREMRVELIDPLIQQYHGRLANTAGDSLLIEFSSAVEAVRFSQSLHQKVASRNEGVGREAKIEYRIGINVGDVMTSGDDLLGDGVNVAARLEAMAPTGGTILSRTVRDQVRDRLELNLADLGEVTVKNIARPLRAFQIMRDGEKPIRPPKAKTRRWPQLVAAAAIISILVGGGMYWHKQTTAFAPVDPANMAYALPERPSIAVLPFKTIGADKSQEWIGDGLTESIISTLSLSPNMVVIARGTSLTYKKRDVEIRDVATELGVRFVLSGSVQSVGENLRVTAELSDAIEGQQLWSLREDGGTEDLFAIQDRISQKLFAELQVSLTFGENARKLTTLAGDFDAWSRHIEGLAEFRKFSPSGHSAAMAIFRALVDQYPNRPLPNLMMGWLHWQKAILGFSEDPAGDMAKARRFSVRTLEISQIGEAYILEATLNLYAKNYEAAIEGVDKALKLAPGSADVHASGGYAKSHSGEPAAGLALMLRSLRLEPAYQQWVPTEITRTYMKLGKFSQAAEMARADLKAGGNYFFAKQNAHSALAAIAVFEGRMNDAELEVSQLLKINPQFTTTNLILGPLRVYKDQEFVQKFAGALELAGLPK